MNAIERLLEQATWHEISPPVQQEDDGIPVVTHETTIMFMGQSLKVLQLSDGQRIIDTEDMARFLGWHDN